MQPRHLASAPLLALAFVLWFSFLPAVVAQTGNSEAGPGPTFNGLTNILDYLHQGSALRVSVLSENKKHLDRQALAKLHCPNPDNTVYQTTRGESETIFPGLHVCNYELDISAVGYLSVHKTIEVTGYVDNINLEITLQKDPMAVNFDASGTADALMSAKASKETRRAEKALQEGSLKEAHKRLESAYKQAPSSSRVNFLLGYDYFQQKDFEEAQTYLAQSAALDPKNAQALGLLGRVEILRGQQDQARAALERAVDANPGDTLARDFLGDIYIKQKEYDKAKQQAQLVLAKNKDDANAKLILGEAEGNLGQNQEAIESLKAYLQAMPTSPSAGQVRDIIADLQKRAVETAAAAIPTVGLTAAGSDDPVMDTPEPKLSVAWQPAGVDSVKPSVAPGVSCPTEQVLEGAGKHAQELVEDVGRFAAIEDLLHERLDSSGNPTSREVRKFEYAANVSEARPGFLMLDEYRTQPYGLDNLPDDIATSGFPALALVFHPTLRGNYDMECEGLGEWQGKPTWLVHFRQRQDRPSRIQTFKVGYSAYSVDLKGRAWVAADTFQIVRIETELVNPMKPIQYMVQHSITEYSPVHFAKKNLDIWLPKTAEVYLELRHHRYYRRHSFDHYMLFSVDSDQKVREAKHEPHGPASTTPKKRRKYWPA